MYAPIDDYESCYLGGTPHDEPCTQAGQNEKMNKLECEVYRQQLMRTYGTPPAGSFIKVQRNDHEFGVYYDLEFMYPADLDEESEDEYLSYMWKLEQGCENWDKEALKELKENNYNLLSNR